MSKILVRILIEPGVFCSAFDFFIKKPKVFILYISLASLVSLFKGEVLGALGFAITGGLLFFYINQSRKVIDGVVLMLFPPFTMNIADSREVSKIHSYNIFYALVAHLFFLYLLVFS